MKMVTDILGISISLSDKVIDIAGILFGLSALAIILTNGRDQTRLSAY